jgi:hypothetical protein
MTFVKAYYRGRKPGPTTEFVATTKALAGHVLSQREWNEFVGDLLVSELLDVLPKWVEQDRLSQFPEDMRERVEQSF